MATHTTDPADLMATRKEVIRIDPEVKHRIAFEKIGTILYFDLAEVEKGRALEWVREVYRHSFEHREQCVVSLNLLGSPGHIIPPREVPEVLRAGAVYHELTDEELARGSNDAEGRRALFQARFDQAFSGCRPRDVAIERSGRVAAARRGHAEVEWNLYGSGI